MGYALWIFKCFNKNKNKTFTEKKQTPDFAHAAWIKNLIVFNDKNDVKFYL